MIWKKRVIIMLHKVKFNDLEDVREFVEAASECKCDIDISYDRVLVDAKSIMGVLGMDLRRDLTVNCHGECAEFARTIRKWCVA